MVKKSKKFRITRKLALISGTAIVVIIASGLGYWHYHNRPSQVVINVPPAKTTSPITNSPNSRSSSDSTSTKQTPSSGGYTSSPTNQSPSNGTSQPPLMPTGDFVSNHKPGQNGSPTTENSVCDTTPGASCYIKFTNGNTSLQLQAGTADSNGSVYWNNWNISDYAFTTGQWTITATATLNGQSETASDATPLTIQ